MRPAFSALLAGLCAFRSVDLADRGRDRGYARTRRSIRFDRAGADMRLRDSLSECRANAAKTNMVGKGIPDASISTSGKGESELMVQTGDGVKEPQNRRATVDLE